MAANDEFDTAYQAALAQAAQQIQPQQGLRRRTPWLDSGPVDERDDWQKERQATGLRTEAYLPTLRGLYSQLTGDQAAAKQQYAQADALEQRAQQADSNASANPMDWGSIDDGLRGVRKLFTQSAPDMAASMVAGGVGRGLARRAATSVERQALAGTMARELEGTSGVSSPLGQRVAAEQARASAQAGDEAAAAAQRQEALQRVAAQDVQADAGAQARIARAGQLGAFAGATAGQFPGQLSGSREYLEKNPDATSAAKIGLADLGSSALGSLDEVRLLGRVFDNPVAQQAVRGSLGQFLPRVAKEAAKQGLWEGSTEALQEAAQRAGHKWVDSNVDMLSPEALNDYAANFLGGAIMGGVMGGATEAAHQAPMAGLDAAGAAARGARWAWDSTGGARQAVRERLAGLAGRLSFGEAGQPMGGATDAAAGGAEAAPDMASRFQQAAGAVRRWGSQAADTVTEAARNLRERMQPAALKDDEIDNATDAVMDRIGEMASRPDSGRPIGELPARLGRTPVQKWMLANLNQDYLAGLNEDAAKDLPAALEKYTTDRDLTGREHRTLREALANPNSGLDQTQLNAYAAVVPQWMRMSQADGAPQRARGQLAGLDTEGQATEDASHETAASEAEANARDAGEDWGADFGGDRELGFFAGERPTEKDTPLVDRLNSVRQSMLRLAEDGRQAPEAERAALRQQYAQLQQEHAGLQQQIREAIGRGGGVITRNGTGNGPAFYAKRLRDPDTIELQDKAQIPMKNGATLEQPQMIDLGTMIKRQQAAVRAEGTAADNVDAKTALLRGLSEAIQAGMRPNLDTLSLGAIRDSKSGDLLLRITPALRAELRESLKDYQSKAPPPRAAATSEDLDADFERATRYEREDSREPSDSEAENYAQGAREAPPGVDSGDRGARFVPSLGSPVSNVSFNNPYERQLQDYTKARNHAPTPRERAAAVQRYGEQIGANEIAREVELGTMEGPDESARSRANAKRAELVAKHNASSDPQERRQYKAAIASHDVANQRLFRVTRAERELARLRDPGTGLAKQYLIRAGRGELGGVSMRHMPADTAARATGENADEAYTRAHLGENKGDGAFERAIAAKRKRVQVSTERDVGPSRRPVKARNPETGKLEMTRRDTRQIARPTEVRQAQEAAKNPGTSRDTARREQSTARAEPATKRQVAKKDGSVRPATLNDRTESTKETFEARVDALFDGAKPEPRGVRVLDEGDLLTLLGYGKGEVVLAENHVVNDGRTNHALTREDVKRIPEWLENPVAVFERPENGGNLTFVAYNERTREPMLIAVEPTAERGPRGSVAYRHVTLTAYGSTRAPFARWAREGTMLYRNKKATPAFNRDTGQRLPGSDEGLRGPNGKILSERDLFKYRQQREQQRPAGLNDEAADASGQPAARNRKQVIQNPPKAEAAVDASNTVPPEISARAAESIAGSTHDHTAEKRLLNSLAKMLGVSPIHSVSPLVTAKKNNGGQYTAGRMVQVNDNLSGNERMSVLLHEFGHHVVVDKLSTALGLEPRDVVRMNSDELLAAFDKVRPDVADEYRAWRAANGERTTVKDSPATFFRAAGIGARADTSKTTRPTNFHEWLADNIARALEDNRRVQTTVDKFFSAIADTLKQMYYAIRRDPTLRKYLAAKSVKAWVDDLFNENTQGVREATGVTPTKEGAEATVTAAAIDATGASAAGGGGEDVQSAGRWGEDGEAPMQFTALLRYAREVLPPESRGILERGLSTPAARSAIDSFISHIPDPAASRIKALLGDERTSLEARIALGYMMHRAGALQGESVGLDNLKSWQAWQAGPKTRSAFEGIQTDLANVLGLTANGQLAQKVFEDMASGVIARRVASGRGYTPRSRMERTRQQRVLDKAGDVARTASGVVDRVLGGKWERLRSTDVPMLRRIGGMLQKPQGSQSEESGYIPAVRNVLAQHHAKVAAITKGLTDAQVRHMMSHLQRGTTDFSTSSPEVARAVEGIRQINRDLLPYLRSAGVDIRSRGDNFFPVLMEVTSPAKEATLRKLLSDPDYAEPIQKLFAAAGKDQLTSEQMIDNLVDGAKPAPGNLDPSDNSVPALKAENARSMQFIYDALAKARADGDAAAIAKHEANVRTFASLQTKDPLSYLARYVEPAIKRAEYARRFGADGERLKKMLERAKAQGATDDQIALARDSVKAAIGTYGLGASPTLEAISPALAQRFSGPKTKATIQGLQAYQNLRLLPLSLISSLVDPMGIAVRSGGDFKATWDGFKVGVKAVFDHATREEQRHMLEMLGAADDMFAEVALQPGQSTGFAQKVNDVLFKWNGLAGWTRATRYMALNAGHRFLLTHAFGTSEKSARYMRELGLREGDVRPVGDGRQVRLLTEGELAKASPAEKARDARVKKALMQFVDEAILRPNAMQSPMWVSDPYMGLVSQYKSFAYAIYDQIYKRIFHEINSEGIKGSTRVIAAALMYVPMAAGAELLREWVQTLGQGDPKRKDWGVTDYAVLGAGRTGLFNPKMVAAHDVLQDVQMRKLPGTSQAGPTLTQGGNLLKALEGQRDLGKEFESALPGSAMYRRWNDAPADNDGDAAGKGAGQAA